MRLSMTILVAAALLPGCSRVDEGQSGPPPASPASTQSPAAVEPPPGGWDGTYAAGTRDPAKDEAGPLPPNPHRDLDDLVRGCPGMNPEQRPRGSNCLGIFPEQCGADKAAAHIGEPMTRALAARMEAMAPGGARIIRPGQAVTDDLRQGRLNVLLDEQDRVKEVDCY